MGLVFSLCTRIHGGWSRNSIPATIKKKKKKKKRESCHWTLLDKSSLNPEFQLGAFQGADIARQTINGWTALHCAATNRQSSFVELLLALGTDVDVVTNSGDTACHLASWLERHASLCALVAAGGNLDQLDSNGETPRTIAARRNVQLPTADEIDAARRQIAKTRIDLVRERAFQICVGLQSFRLSALQLCEILMHSFGAIGSLIAFHQWWAIAVKVKHFRDHKQQSSATTTTSATNNETKTQ
jgi:hypothetical protein